MELLFWKLLLTLTVITSRSFQGHALGNQGPEQERDLHKVTQQVSDRPRTGAWVSKFKVGTFRGLVILNLDILQS